MSDDDRDYYYRRAEQEIACAQASRNEEAVRVHYCLAGLYLDRVFGDSPSVPLDTAYGASAESRT